MKLIIFVMESVDADRLSDQLVQAGHAVTKVGSTGGFLRRGSSTIITGVEDDAVSEVIEIARRTTQARANFAPIRQLPFLGELDLASEPVEVPRRGAVLWVLPVERFERL